MNTFYRKPSFPFFLALLLGLPLLSCESEENDSPEYPIVGSWELPGGFNANDPHLITFFTNGQYAVYTDCSQQTNPVPDQNLEIGTYTFSEGELRITGHLQNGCGGFDSDTDATQIPQDAIAISFSNEGNTMSLNGDLSLSRLVDGQNPLVGAWNLPGGFDDEAPHLINFYDNGYYIVYATCDETADPSLVPLEIGTYQNSNTELTILSHVQNGCGGFDSDADPMQIPEGPLSISFGADNSTLNLNNGAVVFTRVR